MPTVIHPGQLERPKDKRKFGVLDALLFLVIAAVIAFLATTLIGKLHLKHEVAGAQVVADRVIGDIAGHKAADARSLGDTKFQANNSVAKLTGIFTAASTIAKGNPEIIRKTVANNQTSQNVFFVYKYNGKTPYYIRIQTSQPKNSDTWYLTGMGGSSSEAALTQAP